MIIPWGRPLWSGPDSSCGTPTLSPPTYRDRQRVSDILAAVEAIRAHRYFDTSHAILQATVDNDLPDLEDPPEVV